MNANIGLGISENDSGSYHDATNTAARNKTYSKVHDQIAEIFNKYKVKPGIMTIQELGFLNWVPQPFFSKPVKHDLEVLANLKGAGRGVGTYSNNPYALAVDAVDKKNEIVTTIDSFINSRGKNVNFAVINVYRLTHKDSTRTIEETCKAIKDTIKKVQTEHKITNL